MSDGMASLYVHSYSYRFRLAHDPEFTVFDLIDDAARRGFDGINVSVYPPDFAHLSGGGAERPPLRIRSPRITMRKSNSRR
jgi:hypothetical protein